MDWFVIFVRKQSSHQGCWLQNAHHDGFAGVGGTFSLADGCYVHMLCEQSLNPCAHAMLKA